MYVWSYFVVEILISGYDMKKNVMNGYDIGCFKI